MYLRRLVHSAGRLLRNTWKCLAVKYIYFPVPGFVKYAVILIYEANRF